MGDCVYFHVLCLDVFCGFITRESQRAGTYEYGEYDAEEGGGGWGWDDGGGWVWEWESYGEFLSRFVSCFLRDGHSQGISSAYEFDVCMYGLFHSNLVPNDRRFLVSDSAYRS